MIMDVLTHYILIHEETSMIHGQVTLHGFSSMIVIHDSFMICHVEEVVKIRQNFLCVSVLIKWRFICCLSSFIAINGISGIGRIFAFCRAFLLTQRTWAENLQSPTSLNIISRLQVILLWEVFL